jgi:hypothetical protein
VHFSHGSNARTVKTTWNHKPPALATPCLADALASPWSFAPTHVFWCMRQACGNRILFGVDVRFGNHLFYECEKCRACFAYACVCVCCSSQAHAAAGRTRQQTKIDACPDAGPPTPSTARYPAGQHLVTRSHQRPFPYTPLPYNSSRRDYSRGRTAVSEPTSSSGDVLEHQLPTSTYPGDCAATTHLESHHKCTFEKCIGNGPQELSVNITAKTTDPPDTEPTNTSSQLRRQG